MLDNLFPIQPSNPLEYCRLFSYKIARFITYFCIDDTGIHREDVTIKLEDARLLANNMRDLVDAYEEMVGAMYHEHDFGVKELQEGNSLRDTIQNQALTLTELRVIIKSLKGDKQHLRASIADLIQENSSLRRALERYKEMMTTDDREELEKI